MTPTILTALKPTGRPHLGNFVGAIEPTLALTERHDADVVVFVADGHALNATRSAAQLRARSLDVVATYIACGLDPERVLLFRQSDVPELFQLSALLGCVCPKGLANRAHAYKAVVARNLERDLDPDTDVNMGLFCYPVLMAADIVGVRATTVPVGPDQLQHIEITRELVRRFNHLYGPILRDPEAAVAVEQSLPGIDGRKMSKSYDNVVPLFGSAKEIRRSVGRIRTSSRAVGEPGDPAGNLVCTLLAAVADPSTLTHAHQRLRAGAGDGELKQLLFEVLRRRFETSQARYDALLRAPDVIETQLARGAHRARSRIGAVLEEVKRATGLGPHVGDCSLGRFAPRS